MAYKDMQYDNVSDFSRRYNQIEPRFKKPTLSSCKQHVTLNAIYCILTAEKMTIFIYFCKVLLKTWIVDTSWNRLIECEFPHFMFHSRHMKKYYTPMNVLLYRSGI